jgi:ketosteroid isomerase-like protein
MITLSDLRFGAEARNRIAESKSPEPEGFLAALESFYYALAHQDAAVLAEVWSEDDLAQLNNPLGGILRGGEAIVDLYRRIFSSRARLDVEFGDFVQYLGVDHALVAGRESGSYTVDGSEPVELSIRTSRYFRYDSSRGRWLQFHHHGSIDAPQALAAYQAAILG